MVSIHDQLVAVDPLRGITAVPVGKIVSEIRFTWIAFKLVETFTA
jgi:hypothetical protein